jgi:hypothetical protein
MGNVLQQNNLDRNVGGSPWAVRRRIIVLTLIFCAGVVTYIMLKGVDSRTNETIVQSAFYLASAVIGSYCFAASWADRAAISNLNINNGPVTDINPGTITNIDNPDAPKH